MVNNEIFLEEMKGKVLKVWCVHGFECRAVVNPLLTINGYVGIPKDHPYHGESYWDFDVNVHGGVTYADFGKDEDETFPHPELYWIGWDSLHSGDWIPHDRRSYGKRWSLEDVIKETEYLAKQLSDLQNFGYNKERIEERLRELTEERTRINKEIRRLRKVRGCE